MRRALPPVTTIALSGALGAAALLGGVAPIGVLLVLVVVLASGWPTLLGLPTPRGSTTVLALSGAIAVLVVSVTTEIDRAQGDSSADSLRWLTPVLACSIVVAFMHQLLRRDMRPRLIDSVTGVLSGVVVIGSAAPWAPAITLDRDLAIAVLVALVAAAAVVWGLGASRWSTLAAVLVGALVAGLAGYQYGVEPVGAFLACVASALLVVAIEVIFGRLPSASSRQAAVAVGAAGVCTSGFLAYLGALLF